MSAKRQSIMDISTTRVMVAITFHFSQARLRFLNEVIRAFLAYKVDDLRIVIVTNTVKDNEVLLLREMIRELSADGVIILDHNSSLSDPFDLAWCHKKFISDVFLVQKQKGDHFTKAFTHFIYTEDDVIITYENFCYFVANRDRLRELRLIPSFIRVEYNGDLSGYVCPDLYKPVTSFDLKFVDFNDEFYLINMPIPYNACFVMDQELAQEYVGTKSFRHNESREMVAWDVRERSAMGLCFESAPANFRWRYVVPIQKKDSQSTINCWVRHLPDNYADDPASKASKIRMGSLFDLRDLTEALSFGSIESDGSKMDAERKINAKTVRKRLFRTDPYLEFSFEDRHIDKQGWGFEHPGFKACIEHIRPEVIFEVGSWKGMSALKMAAIVESINLHTEIVCIDTWLGSSEHITAEHESYYKSLRFKNGFPQMYYTFLSNVLDEGFSHVITPFPTTSENAAIILSKWQVKAGLIHIDGAHEFQAVFRDLNSYYPLLHKFGIMLVANYSDWPEVKRAVELFVETNSLQSMLHCWDDKAMICTTETKDLASSILFP